MFNGFKNSIDHAGCVLTGMKSDVVKNRFKVISDLARHDHAITGRHISPDVEFAAHLGREFSELDIFAAVDLLVGCFDRGNVFVREEYFFFDHPRQSIFDNRFGRGELS